MSSVARGAALRIVARTLRSRPWTGSGKRRMYASTSADLFMCLSTDSVRAIRKRNEDQPDECGERCQQCDRESKRPLHHAGARRRRRAAANERNDSQDDTRTQQRHAAIQQLAVHVHIWVEKKPGLRDDEYENA